MSTLIKNHPVFEDNQVLTSSQLNQMHAYLDQQTRLTRVSLIGLGVVCGMDLVCNAEQSELTITKGVGVTSEGYLITIGECKTTQYRTYTKPNSVSYPPFEDPVTQLQDVELHELLTDDADIDPEDESTVSDLNADFLSDKIVLLLLECYDKDLKSCLGKSCDELGIDRIMTLRKLVIKETVYNEIVKDRVFGGLAETAYPDKSDLPVIQVRRPMLQPNSPATNFYLGMAAEYLNVITDVWEPLNKAMVESYRVYQPVLKNLYDDENPFEIDIMRSIREQLKKYLESYSDFSEPVYGIQYIYDFVKDLVLAYEEFRLTAFDLSGACCPDMRPFPKHLLLGMACAEAGGLCAELQYRNEFIASSAFSDQRFLTEKVQMLHKRLVLLWESLDLERLKNETDLDIKITPSCEKKSSLSERAIPFYYDSKKQSDVADLGTLEDNWNFDLQRQCRGGELPKQLSYDNHQLDIEPYDPVMSPLAYDLDPYNFLRIEGHISKHVDEVEAQLVEMKIRYNLSFDIKKVYFGDLMEEEPLPSCLIEDLQPQYSIWRNKILLYVKNLVQASRTAETTINNRAMFMSEESSGESTDYRTGFSKKKNFNTNFGDITNLFTGADPTNFTHSANRVFNTLHTLDMASNPKFASRSAAYETSEQTNIRQLFSKFNDCLHHLIEAMPRDLREFDMNSWLTHYKCILRVFVEVMKWLASMADNAQYRIQIFLYLVIASFIHRIINFIAIHPYISIRILNDTLQERREALVESLKLSRYRAKHPGLEHKAGVAPGQTFLLAYQLPHEFNDFRDENGNLSPERAISMKEFNFDFENGDFDMERYLEVVKQMNGRVVADFTLPFGCCNPCEDVPSNAVSLDPFVPPVTAIVMTEEALRISAYKSVEIQLINDLYDPDIYKARLASQASFGTTRFREDPYEPNANKTKQMLVYDVNPEELAREINRGSFFVIDEFKYEIFDIRRDEVVGRDTITIFIPIAHQTKPQTGTVSGKVTTVPVEGDERPLPAVDIYVVNTQKGTTTDLEGNYSISNVPVGQQTLEASFVGYNTKRKTVNITAGKNSIDLVMKNAKDININYDRILETLDVKEQPEQEIKIKDYYSTSMNNAKTKASQLVQLEGKGEITPLTRAESAVKEFSDEEEISVVRLNNEYNKVRNELINKIQETKGSEKELHKEALKNTTEAYLNRLAYTQPKNLTSTTKDVLNESATIFKSSKDIDMKKTVEDWEKKSKGYVSKEFQSNLKQHLKLK